MSIIPIDEQSTTKLTKIALIAKEVANWGASPFHVSFLPGYNVHHFVPLYRFGLDTAENMRLIDISMHYVSTGLWRLLK